MFRIVFLVTCTSIIASAQASLNFQPLEFSPRIVGGKEIEISDVPWVVALLLFDRFQYRFNCGGSLVSRTAVISAAHCLTDIPSNGYKVRMGSTNRYKGGYVVNSKRLIIHEGFSNVTFLNDIGIIVLSSPIPENSLSKPVTLPTVGQEVPDGTVAYTIGWGMMWEKGEESDILRKVFLPIVNIYQCKFFNRYTSTVTPNMICAGYVGRGEEDACSGDSGGSLMVDKVMVGITSWGTGCARPYRPGVYTRVSNYLGWINSKIEDTPKSLY